MFFCYHLVIIFLILRKKYLMVFQLYGIEL
jgi:hypothetical protein